MFLLSFFLRKIEVAEFDPKCLEGTRARQLKNITEKVRSEIFKGLKIFKMNEMP